MRSGRIAGAWCGSIGGSMGGSIRQCIMEAFNGGHKGLLQKDIHHVPRETITRYNPRYNPRYNQRYNILHQYIIVYNRVYIRVHTTIYTPPRYFRIYPQKQQEEGWFYQANLPIPDTFIPSYPR